MTIIYRRWIHGVKRKLLRFHRRRPDGSRLKSNEDQEIVQSLRTGKVKGVLVGEEEEEEEYADVKEMRWALQQAVNLLSREEMAAIKIQACFRGHLARRAFRALRGLVRLQAVFRGYRVRQQARIALRCMNSLAKLQVRIRNRQQLTGPSKPTAILPP
ncbi:protein IQ-DOMAIN 16 [Nymphaea colorata]|uniref:protein IQ-DOMAIN 16 n=1 Tax=Nymphaea colorata TaxID=210225 RepID=UPI00129E3AC4|nr:protein IQ-DOMAIN 16 [Nymphaea colorata]